MHSICPANTTRPERVCLRIPVNLPAIIKTCPEKSSKVSLNDLSTTGLSFYATHNDLIPDTLTIALRLPRHLKASHITLGVVHKKSIGSRVLVGCRFMDPAPETTHNILKYILCCLGNALPFIVLGTSVMLLLADALARLFLCIVLFAYKEAPFNQGVNTHAVDTGYFLVLTSYAIACFVACMCVGIIKKPHLLLALGGTAIASVFLSVKLYSISTLTLEGPLGLLSARVLYIEWAIVLIAVFSVGFFVLNLKKMWRAAGALAGSKKLPRGK